MEALLHDISWVVPYRNDFLTPIFRGFTWLGYLPFYMIFLSLSYWLWDKDKATRFAVLIVFAGVMNSFLKDFWQDPRPPIDLRMDSGVAESYGLPSGHAQVTVAMWLWLAYELRRTWGWVLAAIIITGVCFSRIYLGVHDVEDIAAGIALGLLNFAVFYWAVSSDLRRWHDLPSVWQVAIILAFQPIIYLAWPASASPVPGVALGLFLVGWWAGVKLNAHVFEFRRHANLGLAGAGALVGLVGLFALQPAIGNVLQALGLTFDPAYVTTVALALYITIGAPYAFRLARVGA